MNNNYHQKKLRELAEANIESLIAYNEKIRTENEKLKADNDFFKILLDIPVWEENE